MAKKVLVVDDQPELRRLVRLTLELGGYEVFEADSGKRSLELMAVVLPSVVMMDAMMPGCYDGFQACEMIKCTYPDVKVVMLTARAQKSDRKLAEKANADAFIIKPFSPMMLIETIRNLSL